MCMKKNSRPSTFELLSCISNHVDLQSNEYSSPEILFLWCLGDISVKCSKWDSLNCHYIFLSGTVKETGISSSERVD